MAKSPNKLMKWLIEQDQIGQILNDFDIKNLSQSAFGKIMHCDDYTAEQKSELNQAVQEIGGYDVLLAA